MMVTLSFNTRIERIAKGTSPGAIKGPGDRRPSRAGLGVVSLFAALLGFCGLVLLQVATEDTFSADWVYYDQVHWYVTAYHLLIVPAVLLSVLKFRSWPVLRKATVASLLGYVVAFILTSRRDLPVEQL